MKKKYMKPSVEVYPLQNQMTILAGSPTAPIFPGGPFGYAPGTDENKTLKA